MVFQVLTEDGRLAYEMKSVLTQRYRAFEAGEEAEVEVAFVARLAGGTYRVLTVITSVDGRSVLWYDPVGTLIYLAAPYGVAGVADLGAQIRVDGRDIGDYQALAAELGDGRDGRAGAAGSSPGRP